MPLNVKDVETSGEELLMDSQSAINIYVKSALKSNSDLAYTRDEILNLIRGKRVSRGIIGKARVSVSLSTLIHSKTILKKELYYWYNSKKED